MNTQMQGCRILITGDSGLLGANLCFNWCGANVVLGVSRGCAYVKGARHISMDLLNEEALTRLAEEFKPQVIVHTAALVNVDKCESNPEESHRSNVLMTQKVVDLARQLDAFLVYISTDAFYCSPQRETLAKETDLLVLKSEYARTKYAGEQYAMTYNNSLILRTNFFGINLLNKNSFSEWILQGLWEDQILTMAIDVTFSPLLVNDLIRVLERAIAEKLTGVFNAGCTGAISKYEFSVVAKEIFAIPTGTIIPITVENLKFTAWRSSNMAMDNSKLSRALGVAIPTAQESIGHLKALYDMGYNQDLKGAMQDDTNRK